MADTGEGSQRPYSFEFVAAPADLEPCLNSFHIFRSSAGEMEDVLPAYSGQLICHLEGEGAIHFDGEVGQSSDAYFVAPLMKARPFRITGPSLSVGASLNFRGWAALTGSNVQEVHDRILAPEALLDEPIAGRLAELAPAWRRGEVDESGLIDRLADILRDALKPLSRQDVQLIDATLGWLNGSLTPELHDLYDKIPLSERQVQRKVAHFFGKPPATLMRRYRAIRAATLLADPALDPTIEAQVRDAFYDQAHMIREIREFTGRTPTRLLPDKGSMVTDTLGPEGYSVVEVFGGDQDSQLSD